MSLCDISTTIVHYCWTNFFKAWKVRNCMYASLQLLHKVYSIYRQVSKTVCANMEMEGNKEDTPHIYDEVNIFPMRCSKATADSKSTKGLKDEVVFDTADTYIHMHPQLPAYLESTAAVEPTYINCNTKYNKSNDCYIKDEDTCT